MQRLKLNAIKLLTICSITFSGCGVDRPDTDLCVFNTAQLYKYCYNLKKDYDGNGVRKKTAVPKTVRYKDAQSMMIAMDKTVGTDPAGFGNLKVFVRELIERQ